jgi:uncharacterized Zn finger protein (UPF0148 family)
MERLKTGYKTIEQSTPCPKCGIQMVQKTGERPCAYCLTCQKSLAEMKMFHPAWARKAN